MYVCRSPGVGGASSRSDGIGGGTFEVAGIELDKEDSRKARMLYDYEATNEEELTISGGEVLQFLAWMQLQIVITCYYFTLPL